MVRLPEYKFRDFPEPSDDQPFGLRMRQGGVVTSYTRPTSQTLKAICAKATSVVFADRFFYQPVMTFHLFVEHFVPHLAGSESLVLDFMNYRDNSYGSSPEERFSRALSDGKTTAGADYSRVLSEAQAKRYFDYNFHLNGNVVFGDLYRKLNGSAAPIHMSKNMVLVLYLLRKLGLVESWGFQHILHNWRGWKREGDVCEIGTIPSRQKLVPNLVELGMVKTEALPSSLETVCADASGGVSTVSTREYHSLTDLGLRFIESLHPDCYDPFMPRRIEGWQAAGIDASKSQIDRYIKTYFGKQIRFQSKLFSA